ncbi:RCC1-like G exchanging factor-like protein [Aplysia californica]|uniref:RCC1-like G exchanging factor-like protein n=1 Tax=Aplysia californica TaxID=6500 RepID=A0ABM0K4W1_APLCA|nr:RCC1-like G exchanging factor-like protein [Aplysia californica]
MAVYQKCFSIPPRFLCTRCLSHHPAVLTQWASIVETQKRTKYSQRKRKQEERKAQENVYVGEQASKSRIVYAWGLAASGALGIASYMRPSLKFDKQQFAINKINRPARVRFFDIHKLKPLNIACGHGFSLIHAQYQDKKLLLGTGVNTDSQLGYHETPRGSGRVLDQLIEPGRLRLPAQRPDDLNVVSMSCGRAHSAIVVEDEGVFTLGNNASGQCGRPVVEGEDFSKNQTVNKLHDLPEDVVKVVCGQDHTLFLTATGQLWSCGLGADGQTGVGHYNITARPQLVRGDVEGETIVSVSAKGDCTLAVSDKGDLFGWGNSEYSQLASITSESQVNVPRRLPTEICGKVVKAVAGGSMCALLNDQGEVFVWGYGILGKGPALEVTSQPNLIPAAIFGRSELSPDTRVVDIDCGLTYLLAQTDRGDLYSWGRNNQGSLGLGQDKNQYFPWRIALPAETAQFSCGPDHVLAICRSYT